MNQPESIDATKTNPGIHKAFNKDHFSEEEQAILQRLSREWYLTNSGYDFELGHSRFRFFLMKPISSFSEMFNIDRELVCILSDYENFEPRTLDAFDFVTSKFPVLRIENVCRVLISRDRKTEEKIATLLKTDPEQPIVIPFTYEELGSAYGDFFIKNRFRSHFYTRDLFAFLSPLKKDLYFFGRSELIQDIINKHRSGEHSALFGLRKSGKTSIVFAIARSMSANNEDTLIIDCESPSIHKLRWNELLHHVAFLLKQEKKSNFAIQPEKRYTEKKAALLFERDMLGIYEEHNSSTLLIFDEIERISPSTGSSEHWREGDDFVYFWQTLRYFFQKYSHVLTYMLVGTNPHCVEKPTFGIHDNPLFSSIPFQYVPSFSVEQTREMVRKLGRFMGLRFDEILFSKLADDFGGHTFLIRHICSATNSLCKGDRPVQIDKALYEHAKNQFLLNSKQYFEMIIQVLRDWYPDEYDMLVFLATGDLKTFNEFAKENNYYTNHLVGYGLINISQNGYSFKIESIKEYLLNRHRFEHKHLNPEQQLAEISMRRNSLEKNLRMIIRNQLKSFHGRKKAGPRALSAIPENRRKSLPFDIDTLLDSSSSPLYFLDLIEIINREWANFEHVFEMEKDKLLFILREINALRKDAHANHPSEDEFVQIRLHFKKLEEVLTNWTE